MVDFIDVFSDDTKHGHKIPKEKYLSIGKYPIVDQGQEHIAGFTDDCAGLYTDIPAIIFGDHTRVIKYINTPFFLGADGVKLLKGRSENIDYRFCYHFLNKTQIPNTGYNRHFKWLKEVKIPLPPLPTQQKIADILDHANTLIEKRKIQIEKLDLLIKSQFIEMFGDPVTNPMGWEVKQIKDFATVKIGPFGSLLHAEDYIDGGIPLVNPSHIIDGEIITDQKLTLSVEKYESLSAYALQTGDVVLGRRGEIGRCAVVGNSKYLCGTGSMFIRINQDYLPMMLQRIISSKAMRRVLKDKAVGVTMLNLNASSVANLDVIMPPLELQNQFADFVEHVETQKAQLKKGLELLELNYKALMQKCFNGEVE